MQHYDLVPSYYDYVERPFGGWSVRRQAVCHDNAHSQNDNHSQLTIILFTGAKWQAVLGWSGKHGGLWFCWRQQFGLVSAYTKWLKAPFPP